MKTCTICGQTKEVTEFLRDKSAQGGYRNQCKECLRERNNATYERRKDSYNASLRKFRDTVKGATHVSYHAAMRRAKVESLPFDITLEYIRDLFEQQEGLCALSDRPMSPKSGWDSPSLDKIDPNLGYTVGNVQWLTKRMNTIKGNLTGGEFLEMCRKVVEKSSTTIPYGSTPEQVETGCPTKVGEDIV